MQMKTLDRSAFTTAAAKSFIGLSAAFSVLTLAAPAATAADADLEKGKAVFNGPGACNSCHGALGAGDGPAAGALNPKPRSFAEGKFAFDTDGDGKTGTEQDIFNVITNGAMKYGGNVMMVARPDIAEADRKALAKYVLSLHK
jgi:mono/diheme cytochrome c family protein